MDLSLGRYFNVGLVRHPLNWAILFVIATFWLLAFHVVMTGFSAMQAGGDAAFGGPGQVTIPNSQTGLFSQPGLLASVGGGDGIAAFGGYAPVQWTDGTESRYAEDGWYGNP